MDLMKIKSNVFWAAARLIEPPSEKNTSYRIM